MIGIISVVIAVLIFVVTATWKFCEAAQIQRRLVEAFQRDEDVLDVADMATDSSE